MYKIDPYARRALQPFTVSLKRMIGSNYGTKANQHIKQPFRKTGPLDAYIYQKRGDEENVEQRDVEVAIHLTEPVKIGTTIHIFTDGACPNNGKRGASAAWGVLVVSNEGYRVLEEDSSAIPVSEPQTNQRAELRGLLRGLEIAEHYLAQGLATNVQIWCDSQYAIKCTSEWGPTWKSNGWVKKGGDIQHLDVIKPLVGLYTKHFSNLRLKWVKGHVTGVQQHQFPWMFNHRVDALAVSALR